MQLKLYHIFYYLLFGIGGAVIIGPLLGFIVNSFLGSILGKLLSGLLLGFLFKVRTNREPAEVVKWSWRKEGWRFVSLLLFVLIAGSTISTLLGVLAGSALRTGSSFRSLSCSLAMGRLSEQSLYTYTLFTPTQGLWSSTRNSIVGGRLFGLLIGAVFGVIVSPGFGLLLGLFSGVFLWLLLGGDVSIKQTILRVLLWRIKHFPSIFLTFLTALLNCLAARQVAAIPSYIIYCLSILQD